MEWTPIRIRGKRKRSTASTLSTFDKPKKKGGRPLGSTSSTTSAASSRANTPSRATQKTKTGRKPAKALSLIEKLPTELLEDIFLRCRNIALPRSSPAIATKLSSELVYMDFALRMFAGSLTLELPIGRTPRCITELINCQFFTWSFYKKFAIKAYSQWLPQTTTIDHMFDIDLALGLEDCLLARRDRLRILRPSEANCKPDFSNAKYHYLSGLYLGHGPDAFLPSKLLQGPWTDDKQEFLWFLGRHGWRVDVRGPCDGEVAWKGLLDAIHDGRYPKVVACLALALSPSERDVTPLIQAAVIEAGCRREIVVQLLYHCRVPGHREKPLFNPRSPELWAWAEHEAEKGNVDGNWLKDVLIRSTESKVMIWWAEDGDGAIWRLPGMNVDNLGV